ncbi:hypothetical protein, partial [Acinetobacter soli]|uniref:hypothetical protein n=1 Tax=Acinetobacter soli TaxID=487316 RepID=UPI00125E7281
MALVPLSTNVAATPVNASLTAVGLRSSTPETADSPEFVRHYSRQDLNEIAQVYAYWYSDEKTNPLNAKRLAV